MGWPSPSLGGLQMSDSLAINCGMAIICPYALETSSLPYSLVPLKPLGDHPCSRVAFFQVLAAPFP